MRTFGVVFLAGFGTVAVACGGGSSAKTEADGGAGTGGANAGTGGASAGSGTGGGGMGGTVEGQIGLGLEGEKASDQFGSAVALSANGKRLVIGSELNDGTGAEAGHARVFELTAGSWVQLGLDIDGEAAGDRSGSAVAISADGSRVAIGAYLNDGGGSASGHVRVFDYVAGAWTQVGADIDGAASSTAGASLAMSADGTRVVIGAPAANSVNGGARVYDFKGGVWTQVGATISGTNELGSAVAISGAGDRIAVSSPSAAGSSRIGTVDVFDWNGTAWTPTAGSPISGQEVADNFGSALSFSSDGNTLAVGAISDDGLGLAGGGAPGGTVRVFRFAAGAWTQLGADLDGEPGNQFGGSVSLSADGTRLLMGAPPASTVRFYTLTGGTWTLATTPQFAHDSRAGEAVAISGDGHTAAVGAIYFRGVAGSATGVVRSYELP